MKDKARSVETLNRNIKLVTNAIQYRRIGNVLITSLSLDYRSLDKPKDLYGFIKKNAELLKKTSIGDLATGQEKL